MLSRSRSNSESGRESGNRDRRNTMSSGTAVIVVGVLTTLLLCAGIAYLQALGQSAAAQAMPDMGMQNMALYWLFPILQASGLTGLFFAYVSVLLGLLQSGRATSWFPMSYRQIDRFHRHLALLVIAITARASLHSGPQGCRLGCCPGAATRSIKSP
jgi:hypothetical protein